MTTVLLLDKCDCGELAPIRAGWFQILFVNPALHWQGWVRIQTYQKHYWAVKTIEPVAWALADGRNVDYYKLVWAKEPEWEGKMRVEVQSIIRVLDDDGTEVCSLTPEQALAAMGGLERADLCSLIRAQKNPPAPGSGASIPPEGERGDGA